MKSIITFFFVCIPAFTSAQYHHDYIIATFGGIINGELTKEEIFITDSVQLFVRSDKKNQEVIVLSYEIYTGIGGFDLWEENNANHLNEKQIKAIQGLSIDRIFYVQKIKVLVDDSIVELGPIRIRIAGPQACLNDISSGLEYKYHAFGDTNQVREVYRKVYKGTENIKTENIVKNEHLLVSGYNQLRQVDIGLKIIEYDFWANRNNETIEIENIEGDRITEEIVGIIKTLKTNDSFGYRNITAIDIENVQHEVAPLRLKLGD